MSYKRREGMSDEEFAVINRALLANANKGFAAAENMIRTAELHKVYEAVASGQDVALWIKQRIADLDT